MKEQRTANPTETAGGSEQLPSDTPGGGLSGLRDIDDRFVIVGAEVIDGRLEPVEGPRTSVAERDPITDDERAVIALAIRWNETHDAKDEGESALMAAVEQLLSTGDHKEWAAKLAKYEPFTKDTR